MKQLKEIVKTMITTPILRLVHYIAVIGGWRKLDQPTDPNSLKCLICDGSDHYITLCDPKKGVEAVWICANRNCEVTSKKNRPASTAIPLTSRCGVLWPLFCEINGIGDIYHAIKFQDIDQSPQKIQYLRKFVEKPCGLIFMQGTPGSGKTFAALATCELYTQKETSCLFTTHKNMHTKWTESFKDDRLNNYIDKLKNVSLLVIDDLGTAESSPSFSSFFMDILDYRLQWTTKGTIITTNLRDKALSAYCGDSLMDRLKTGQLFDFKHQSRRNKKVL